MAWNTPGKKPTNLPDLEAWLKRLFKFNKPKMGLPASKPKAWHVSGWLLLLIVIFWALSGIFSVQTGEQAAVFRLGQYQATYTDGVHWYPRLLENKYQINTKQIHKIAVDKQLLTADGDVVTVNLSVQYQATDIKPYLLTAKDPDQTLKQMVEALLQQQVGSMSFAQLATDQAVVENTIRNQLNPEVSQFGINIYAISLGSIGVASEVKTALSALAKAKTDSDAAAQAAQAVGEQSIANANAEAAKLLAQANVDQQQLIINAKADVADFNSLLPQYQQAPQFVMQQLYRQTMTSLLEKGRVVVADGNSVNVSFAATSSAAVSQPQQAAVTNMVPVSASSNINTPATASSSADSLQTKAKAYARWQEANQ